MAPPRRGEGRRRLGRRLLLLALAALGTLQLTAVSAAEETTVEPAETASGFGWSPSSVSSMPGGTVAFRNPGNVVPHGVHWTGGPEKPTCSGVPVDNFGTNWSGSCTFAQAGAYTFVCTVHPEEMRGTIAVSSGEAPTSPSPGAGQPPAPSDGRVVEAVRLAKKQRGNAIRGSITVSANAVGGRLGIELRARRSSLGDQGKSLVRIGKLTRSIAGAGRLPFVVRLEPLAQRALRRRGRLPVFVKTVVTPPAGPAATMTRRVKLSG
jgi:plastocyanin